MKEMFLNMRQKLTAGEDLVLVTVIASSGATPRGAGARMLVGREGRICGTIGGGAVEYRSQQIALGLLRDKTSVEQDFSLTRDDVQNLGMICGGAVKVYFRFLPAFDPQVLAITEKALALLETGDDLWLLTEISNGGRLGLYTREDGFLGIDGPKWLEEKLSHKPIRVTEEGRDFYAEQTSAAGKVYVFGCGHVAQELVPVLSHVGFRCVALDDRPEFANQALFPTAQSVGLIDFTDIFKTVTLTEKDFVCVMTRGHAYDAVIQAQVLRTPACYIGVIGSAHKKAGVFQKLREEYGFTDRDFARITSPIGLNIKAETPAEIAISIAAQMIQVRAELGER